ncbi:MAG: metalloregulator ArsR/SmtB family transcription factor [Brumimicrobium sp.]|nr:metalloregulator ArsR/SmtB family transcription factor [Brumimicrobium sp.]
MGLTKTALFTDKQNEMAAFAKCFAHPARIAILDYLLHKNACVNSTLVNELGLAQATISQHLRELKNVGIIKGTIEGTSMNYCINTEVWIEIENAFNSFFDRHKPEEKEACC